MGKSVWCQLIKEGSQFCLSDKGQTRQNLWYAWTPFCAMINMHQFLEMVLIELSYCKIHNFSLSSIPLTDTFYFFFKFEKILMTFKLPQITCQ